MDARTVLRLASNLPDISTASQAPGVVGGIRTCQRRMVNLSLTLYPPANICHILLAVCSRLAKVVNRADQLANDSQEQQGGVTTDRY